MIFYIYVKAAVLVMRCLSRTGKIPSLEDAVAQTFCNRRAAVLEASS